MDTIYALSSGSPPAGIAIIRISGSHAGAALAQLAGSLPVPRKASLRTLSDRNKLVLDQALTLWFPGPATATGEDMAELHLHGGRAVVAAVEAALSFIPHLRKAEAGEFTRRAFANGRMDLAEAEGLADLLSAETELQRRSAIALTTGALSSQVEIWRDTVLQLSAHIEAVLDFSDEDDVAALPAEFLARVSGLARELGSWLARPRAERLKDGIRVVLAGPPNSGKSTLFNALLGDDAAITSPIAGTTRDVLERPVALAGLPFLFVDTAGLRDDSGDEIEQIGIERALIQTQNADIILWLGAEGLGPAGAWELDVKNDQAGHQPKSAPRLSLSAKNGSGIDALMAELIAAGQNLLPLPGAAALNKRQHGLVSDAQGALADIGSLDDPLLIGEALRVARTAFDKLIGRASTEDMLDALFGRFCIGK